MIICFSGTGNSRYVALQVVQQTGDTCFRQLEHKDLLDPASLRLEARGERVVWVFPTYSWGIPPVLVEVMRKATIEGAESLPHFMITTCGDDAGLTDRQWRRLMRQRGWEARGAWSVEMPNTYTLMKGFDVDPQDVAQRKLKAAPERIKAVVSAIVIGSTATDVVRGSFAWFKSRVIYPWFIRFAMSPKPFAATDACVSCGRCADTCPMCNITMSDARQPRPQWADRCALCLRCYHICPVHAVRYGRETLDKGQYREFLVK